jgi:hypothetical protein
MFSQLSKPLFRTRTEAPDPEHPLADRAGELLGNESSEEGCNYYAADRLPTTCYTVSPGWQGSLRTFRTDSKDFGAIEPGLSATK